MRRPLAQLWFAATGLVATLAVLVDLVVEVRAAPPGLASGSAAALDTLWFYTTQSNILVAGACFTLALRPERRSQAFRVFMLVALTAISMTGIVFNTVLSEARGTGAAAVGSDLAHIGTPVLAAMGWLLFGPRGALSWDLIPRALLFPVAWTVATFFRGALMDGYPYFFVDARRLGYPTAILNVAGLGVVFVALAAVFVLLDRLPWRDGRDPRPADGPVGQPSTRR